MRDLLPELRDKLKSLWEHQEMRRLLLFTLLGGVFWLGGFLLLGDAKLERQTLNMEKGRFRTFRTVLGEYESFKKSSPSEDEARALQGHRLERLDALLGLLKLKDRVEQLAASGNTVSLELRDLYGEELLTLLEQMGQEELFLRGAELRALQAGKHPLYSITMVLDEKKQ